MGGGVKEETPENKAKRREVDIVKDQVFKAWFEHLDPILLHPPALEVLGKNFPFSLKL